MTDERLEELRAAMAESPVGAYATELLAALDAERATNAKRDRLACEMVTTAAAVLGEAQRQIVEARAELDRLRAAADSFRSYLGLLGERHNELADRSESARHRDAYIAIAGAIAGIEAQGRTLGLWK